jgi:hypothetical protein
MLAEQLMRNLLAPLLVLVTACAVNAGGLGGPPFTNGSPLVSGVDGSYQANARANNLTGVIRFAYSNGIQTTSTTSNSYIFFASGLVFSGPVTASIANAGLAGVLDSQTAAFSNTQATGSFSGRFDQSSPTYFFRGTGFLQTFISTTVGGTTTFTNLFGQSFQFNGVRNSQTTN